jgi:hypothetical protein
MEVRLNFAVPVTVCVSLPTFTVPTTTSYVHE